MTDTILFMVAGATVLFCMGVLVGSGLHTKSIDRKYRRLAQLVRYLNEQDVVMDVMPSEYLDQSTSRVASTNPIVPPRFSAAG
ncbi:MAG: hypothetical protein LC808_31295 [Actinobacteria bacterium]|nr:hypothetical protein [Actinomycetota bacterium]